MTTFVSKLQAIDLPPEVAIYGHPPAAPSGVRMDGPAQSVMTDLKHVHVITVGPMETIEFALRLMIHAKVRLLGVVDSGSQLLGLITARDVTGERPVGVATRVGTRRDELRVEQVMTPRAEINPLLFKDVEHASVRDIVVFLRGAGRQHALVVELDDDEEHYVTRGIFSITQIGRQLGVDISPDGHMQSFAELEHLLAQNSRLSS